MTRRYGRIEEKVNRLIDECGGDMAELRMLRIAFFAGAGNLSQRIDSLEEGEECDK